MKSVESLAADRLEQFSPETWVELLHLADVLEANAGDWIYEAGDIDDRLFIVLQGRVALMRSRRTRVGIFRVRGETISHASSQLSTPKRYGSAVTEDGTRLLKIARSDVFTLCANKEDFLRFVINDLSEQVQRTLTFLNQERELPIEQRLAGQLADLGAFNQTIDLTQDELAQLIGTSRVSAAKLLSKFEKAGLIRRLYRQIDILDSDGLRALANTG